MRAHPSRRSALAFIAIAAGLIAPAGCRSYPELAKPGGGEDVVMPSEPFNGNYPVECPNVKSSAAADSAPAVHGDSTPPVSLAGPIQHIPEFHDCQRLTIHGGRAFGPLVGVWARNRLEAVREEMYRKATGVPVAELYDFTTSPYRPLGIAPGYNCLYLKMGARWEARMVSQKGADTCPEEIDARAWAVGHPLRVERHTDAADLGQIPAAARWDYDEQSGLHYIGVRCGDAWCEIGNRNAPFKTSTWYANRPTEHIKGWYDEQWLAVPDAGGRLVPGPRTRLYPTADLERMPEARFECRSPCRLRDAWVPVAHAAFVNTGHPSYISKLNLRPGVVSEISMRFERTATGNRWAARIISGGDTAYKKVLRVDHTGSFVPGTARWQWRENDERAWVRCPAGCCSVTEVDM